MQLRRSPSTRDTESDPLCESQKEISTFGSSLRANAAPACMYSSGEPAGTENWVASCVSAIAAAPASASHTTPAFRINGAAANQSGGEDRLGDSSIMQLPSKFPDRGCPGVATACILWVAAATRA